VPRLKTFSAVLINTSRGPHDAGQAEEVWPCIVRTGFANIERVARGEPPLYRAPALD